MTAKGNQFSHNKRVSEMWAPLATSRQPAEGPEQAAKCAICF